MMDLQNCSFIHSKLTPPTTTVFIVFFTIAGLIATLGNILALVVLLQPRMRNKSTKVLVSLALSDTLVGCVLCMFNVYELNETRLLRDCNYEFARIFLTISCIGVSAINVGLIAYDRYILLTRLEPGFQARDSTKKTMVLICLSWILPGGLYSAFYFNIYLRNLLMCLIILGPLASLAYFYGLITKAVKGKGMKTNPVDDNVDELQMRENGKLRKIQQQRHSKLASTVIYLIVFYMVCLTPAAIAIIMNVVYIVTKTEEPVLVQNYFLFSVLASSLNSCINPIIYASKYPDFRHTLKEVLGNIKWDKTLSHHVADESTSQQQSK